MNEIAVDYGRKRTGFAIFLVGTVLPLPPLTETTWSKIADRLKHLQTDNGTGRIILGHPLTAAGKPTEMSDEVEKLAEYLETRGFVVELIRETGSTVETEGVPRAINRRDGKRDSLAAMVILKRYLSMP